MFLLKENYGYQGCGIFNTSDEAHDWLNDEKKTYLKISKLAAFLHESHCQDRILSAEEAREVSKDIERLHSFLDRIAVVNIKKHSGASKSKDQEIRKESVANSCILKTQILNLNPSIIIAGGTVCWDSLIHDIEIFNSDIVCSKHEAIKVGDKILCHANHPSAWTGGGFDPIILHEKIYNASRDRTNK